MWHRWWTNPSSHFGCSAPAKKGDYGAFPVDNLPLIESLVSNLASNLSIFVSCKIRVFSKLEKTLRWQPYITSQIMVVKLSKTQSLRQGISCGLHSFLFIKSSLSDTMFHLITIAVELC